MDISLTSATVLPHDGAAGTLIGRTWVPGNPAGPSVVLVNGKYLKDLSSRFPTMSVLLAQPDTLVAVREAAKSVATLCGLEECLANTPSERRSGGGHQEFAAGAPDHASACRDGRTLPS